MSGCHFSEAPLTDEYVFNTTFSKTVINNIYAANPIGEDPVTGDIAFTDEKAGDFTLSAFSAGIGSGLDGDDLGYKPFDRSSFIVGMNTISNVTLVSGSHTFNALARNGTGIPSYRWKLDDLNNNTQGVWTDYSAQTSYTPNLTAGRFKLTVEAKDEADSVSSFSRSFYVAANKVYLVKAGSPGNTPTPPYSYPGHAANDIQDAILYCADGSEMIVSDGDYGVTRELYVPQAITIRSLNGPEKTSIYRIGKYKGGTSSRVVHIRAKGAILDGFAVTNGYYQNEYVMDLGCNIGLYYGTVTNCIVERAAGPYGQNCSSAVGVMNGKIYDTIIRNNELAGQGGGVFLKGADAALIRCTVTNHLSKNYYTTGLGVNADGGLVDSCLIAYNSNQYGGNGGCAGGIYMAANTELRNSIICYNKSGKNDGGGVLLAGAGCKVINCTIANNASTDMGGGIHNSKSGNSQTIINTVLYNNEAPTSGADWSSFDASKCIISNITVTAEADAIGENCVILGANADAKNFTDSGNGDYTILQSSDLRDKGVLHDWTETDKDFAGNPRISNSIVDIGACEFQMSDNLLCSFTITGHDTAGSNVVATATVDGKDLAGLKCRWRTYNVLTKEYSDWTDWSDSKVFTTQLPSGNYKFELEVKNAGGKEASCALDTVYSVVAKDIYLCQEKDHIGTSAFPYSGWQTAATNIFDALSVAGNGSTIHVKDGFYGITEPIILDKAITLISLSGPKKTSIFRAYPRTGDYPVFRPITLENSGATFAGFTVSNGNSNASGGHSYLGTAIYSNGAVISNCVTTCNTVSINQGEYGSVIANRNGVIVDTEICGNTGGSSVGMALYQTGEGAITKRCKIYNNSVTSYYSDGAVVMEDGLILQCVITNNINDHDGNGGWAGGATIKKGAIKDSLVVGNKCGSGGGGIRIKSGEIIGCTVVANTAMGALNARAGGIVIDDNGNAGTVAITNTIIYGNNNTRVTGADTQTLAKNIARHDNSAIVYLSHTLTDNLNTITNNLAKIGDVDNCFMKDPGFVKPDEGDYHLIRKSPCRLTGIPLGYMSETFDLDGLPRLGHRNKVDLGCYQNKYIPPPTLMILK